MAQKYFSQQSSIIEKLVKEDHEFRHLYKEHQSLEAKLEEIDNRRYLSDEEQLERRRIQKMKLIGKDRMEEILRTHSARGDAAI